MDKKNFLSIQYLKQSFSVRVRRFFNPSYIDKTEYSSINVEDEKLFCNSLICFMKRIAQA